MFMLLFTEEQDLIKPTTIGDRVAEIIRDKIINGELPAGTRLTEDGFAKALGVSRPCVKEAFIILESEGLVTRRVNKYTEVTEFNKQDIEEIISLRAAIEALCAETSIHNQTVPVDKMQSILAELKSLKDTDSSVKEHILMDLRFHKSIVVSSQNTRAIDIWKGLEIQMKTILLSIQNKFPEEILNTAYVHSEIMDAMISGKTDIAGSVIKNHVLTNLSLLKKLYEKR